MWVFPLSGPITGRQTASNLSRLDERRPGAMTRGSDTKGGWEKWQWVEGGRGGGGGVGEGRWIMNYKCVTNEGSVEVGRALWTTPSINSSNKTGGSVAQQEDGGDSHTAAAATAARLSRQNDGCQWRREKLNVLNVQVAERQKPVLQNAKHFYEHRYKFANSETSCAVGTDRTHNKTAVIGLCVRHKKGKKGLGCSPPRFVQTEF